MFWLLIFPIIGILLICFGVYKRIKAKEKLNSGNYAVCQGDVIDYKTYQGDEGGTMYNAIYEFEVNGNTYRCVGTTGTSWRPKKPKKILYEKNNPTNSEVLNEGNIAIIIAGIIFFGGGLISIIQTLGGFR